MGITGDQHVLAPGVVTALWCEETGSAAFGFLDKNIKLFKARWNLKSVQF